LGPLKKTKGLFLIILGLESSCDDTGVGIVSDARRILAHRLSTQTAEHQPFGGVVPEVAARAHLDHVQALVREALAEARLTLDDITGIAATCGPGLIGGVMVGAMAGKALAAARNLPFVAVNHLEAHALTARLTNDVAFPYLLLLVSGGHTQLLYVKGVGDYRRLGTTIDDAAGECFDKSAKLLGLGYPGGPELEKVAAGGDASRYDLPRPMIGRAGCDFSFSGLKTAVRLSVQKHAGEDRFLPDMAASVQKAIADILSDRTGRAFEILRSENAAVSALVVAGGVAANGAVRAALENTAKRNGVSLQSAPPKLCTDNGVMVAWAGLERLRLGLSDDLSVAARPRWPLDIKAT
jgi:N6-L-threonylcarbamoyladenine synthase